MDKETGHEGAPQRQTQSGPARMMSERMSIYYSNTAMVATSPRDISLFFGRYVPASNAKGEQSMVELYEQQIYMTLGQAEDLVRILSQTLEAMKARMQAGASSQP
jgi:hypothetical protein